MVQHVVCCSKYSFGGKIIHVLIKRPSNSRSTGAGHCRHGHEGASSGLGWLAFCVGFLVFFFNKRLRNQWCSFDACSCGVEGFPLGLDGLLGDRGFIRISRPAPHPLKSHLTPTPRRPPPPPPSSLHHQQTAPRVPLLTPSPERQTLNP